MYSKLRGNLVATVARPAGRIVPPSSVPPGSADGGGSCHPCGMFLRAPVSAVLDARAASPGRRAPLRLLLALALLIAAPGAAAQTATLRVATVAGADRFVPEARLELRDLPAGARDRVRVALVASAAPGVDLEAQARRAFGPLGTVVVETGVGVRFAEAPAVRGHAVLRGQLGPVAARLEARARSAAERRFDPLDASGSDPFGSGASLRLAGEGRLTGTWLAGADLAVRTDLKGSWLLDADATVRARRAFGAEWDALGAVESRIAANGGGAIGFGTGVAHVPRRAPEVRFVAYLDARADDAGTVWLPGLVTRGTWVGPMGDRFGWDVHLRPAGRRVAPLAVQASWRPSGAGDAPTATVGVRGGGPEGTAWSVALAWTRGLEGDVWRVP